MTKPHVKLILTWPNIQADVGLSREEARRVAKSLLKYADREKCAEPHVVEILGPGQWTATAEPNSLSAESALCILKQVFQTFEDKGLVVYYQRGAIGNLRFHPERLIVLEKASA